VQQYLIFVSSSSVVHHIVFIVTVMLYVVIVASSSCPPSYWLDHIVHSPTLVGFCLSDAVIAVGPWSASRRTTAHAHRRPRAFGWTLGEGAHVRKYPMHCLIVVIMVVHHPSSTLSVSIVNRPLSTITLSPHLPLLFVLNIIATSGSNG
jgi:hypothetical protein